MNITQFLLLSVIACCKTHSTAFYPSAKAGGNGYAEGFGDIVVAACGAYALFVAAHGVCRNSDYRNILPECFDLPGGFDAIHYRHFQAVKL